MFLFLTFFSLRLLHDIQNYLPWIFGIAGIFRIDEILDSFFFRHAESKSVIIQINDHYESGKDTYLSLIIDL